MPQSLAIGNGNLGVNLDSKLQMRDFYYPYIGQENQSEFGEPHKIGVYVDGEMVWFSDDGWHFDIQYHKNSLVGKSFATHNRLGLELCLEDFVYTTSDILFRKIKITNHKDYSRNIKIFIHHDFHIYGDKKQETAEYDPDLKGVLHYRLARYFFVGGQWDNGEFLTDFATGKTDDTAHEGTFRDAEDGHLEGNPIEQGAVDSTIGFEQNFKSKQSKDLTTWVIAGQNYESIQKSSDRIRELGSEKIFHHTKNYWEEWSQKNAEKLPSVSDRAKNLFHQSKLIVKSQTDNRGAIIASTDSDIMLFNRDTYTYMWPRDGSLVSIAMSKLGYFEISRNFLEFCQKIVHEAGFVHHKFTPSGDLGSSWHPRFKNGKKQLPIQEDESALILVALNEFYKNTGSIEVVQKFFNGMVLKIGRFLVNFIDSKTGLPFPSYDLWEEQFGVFSYTASTTYAGLLAAAELSKCTGHYEDEIVFKKAAQKLKKAILKHLFCEKNNRFLKKVSLESGQITHSDATIDASLAFVWEMGVLPADDPRIMATMQAIEEHLSVKTDVGGIARYTGDYYQRNPNQFYSDAIPGNPWIITTLWLANWYIAIAKTKKDLTKPQEIIEWCTQKSSAAGILPEQVDPFTHQPLSVAPLTWSHATFVDTVRRLSEKETDR